VAAFGHPGTVGADRKSLRTPDTHPPRAYAKWSGREDLNLRPPEPHSGALARLRYVPTVGNHVAPLPSAVKHMSSPLSVASASMSR
jgi:hypothetical protein